MTFCTVICGLQGKHPTDFILGRGGQCACGCSMCVAEEKQLLKTDGAPPVPVLCGVVRTSQDVQIIYHHLELQRLFDYLII